MKVYIVSSCLFFREGIVANLSNHYNNFSLIGLDTLDKFIVDKDEESLFIVDIDKHNYTELENIRKIMLGNNRYKFLIIDFYEDIDLFLQTVDMGIDGYVVYTKDCNDILNAIKFIVNGRKYYDSNMAIHAIKRNTNGEVTKLTQREKELLISIGKGLTNKEIANKFYITENTVKKHISSIFAKLNLRDRVEAVIYAYNNGLLTQKENNYLENIHY